MGGNKASIQGWLTAQKNYLKRSGNSHVTHVCDVEKKSCGFLTGQLNLVVMFRLLCQPDRAIYCLNLQTRGQEMKPYAVGYLKLKESIKSLVTQIPCKIVKGTHCSFQTCP